MADLDLDELTKNVAALLLETAAAGVAAESFQAAVQERADEIFEEKEDSIESDAKNLAMERFERLVEARVQEIIKAKDGEIQRRALDLARARVDEMAERLAHTLAYERAKKIAQVRAAAILEESQDEVWEYTDEFLKECAIRQFISENDDEIHNLSEKFWGKGRFRIPHRGRAND